MSSGVQRFVDNTRAKKMKPRRVAKSAKEIAAGQPSGNYTHYVSVRSDRYVFKIRHKKSQEEYTLSVPKPILT